MNTGVPLGGHTLWRVTSPRISLGVSYATTNVQHRNTVRLTVTTFLDAHYIYQLMHKGCEWRFEENIDYSKTSIKRTAKELGKWVPFVPFSSRPSQVETAVHGCNSWLSVWLDHVLVLSFYVDISLLSLFCFMHFTVGFTCIWLRRGVPLLTVHYIWVSLSSCLVQNAKNRIEGVKYRTFFGK